MLESDPLRQVARMLWSLLPYLPLGLLAGLLSGVLGIGGGLVFSPLLLLAGLDPHQALATSTLAIVPRVVGWRWLTIPLSSEEWERIAATEANYWLALAGPSSLASPEATMERTT